MNSLALVLTWALAQGGAQGKTDAEILRMGRTVWFDYYTRTEGSSTADSCDAERIFGEALRRRNDRALKRKPSLRTLILGLRKDLTSYQKAVYDVGCARTGGGTMWNVVYAGILADTEEAIGSMLEFRDPEAKALTVSQVVARFGNLKRAVERERESIEAMPSGGGWRAARGGIVQAERVWKRIVATAAKRPRTESDALLGCCLEALATVEAYVGGES